MYDMDTGVIVKRAGRKVDRVQQVKADLMEKHEKWLAGNNLEALYSHVIHAWRVERILEFTRDIRGKGLDLGCFAGTVAEKILQQGGKEIIGIDRLEKALKLAALRGIQPILADIDDTILDFPDNYFDYALASEVLDYVFDPDAVIAEVRRVLKPGGKLIITVPNLASFGNRLLMLLGRPPYQMEVRPHQGGYWRYFTFDTMRSLLCDHGFVIRRMDSTVFAWPLIRLEFSRWPRLHKFFVKRDEWQQPRIYFSKLLARLLPRLGENIVVLAEKSAPSR
ncbi:MAG: methyltransferase domain-containing protein [bacterium]